MLSQIELLGPSYKTANTFLGEKLKILPIKQQLKWCGILQIPADSLTGKNYTKTIIFNYRNKTKILSN